MTTVDIIEAIDAATGCQQCAGPLGDSPSGDFCGEHCQSSWHASRVPPLAPEPLSPATPGVTWRCYLRGPRLPDGDPRAVWLVSGGADGLPPNALVVPRQVTPALHASYAPTTDRDLYQLRSINGMSLEAWYEA